MSPAAKGAARRASRPQLRHSARSHGWEEFVGWRRPSRGQGCGWRKKTEDRLGHLGVRVRGRVSHMGGEGLEPLGASARGSWPHSPAGLSSTPLSGQQCGGPSSQLPLKLQGP